MRPKVHFSRPVLFVVCILVVLLGGFTASAFASGSSSPATPLCSAKAEAWVSGQTQAQVIGSIDCAPTTTLSTFTYPLGLPHEGEFGGASLVALAWAPDAQHLVVAVSVNDGPTRALFPYIVDTTTHAVTRVLLPESALVSEKGAVNRVFAWVDNHTLLIFGGFSGGTAGSAGTVTYSYDLTSASLTPLPGVTAAYEGVVRGSTLFYLEITPLSQIGTSGRYKGSARLHRYDLTSHREIGTPLTLGDTSTFNGAEGDVTLMGWDASPDGTHIAYQQTSVSTSGSGQPAITSKFFAARADGSGAIAILSGAISTSPAYLAISPDGKLVAVTNAQPTPTVLSGSMSGGSAHYYQPDADGPPVWLNSTQFEAERSAGSGGAIERWQLNTAGGRRAGAVVHTGGTPATLP